MTFCSPCAKLAPGLALGWCFSSCSGGARSPWSMRTQLAVSTVGRWASSALWELPKAVTVTWSRCHARRAWPAPVTYCSGTWRNTGWWILQKCWAGGTQTHRNRHGFPSHLIFFFFLENNTLQLFRAIGICSSCPSDPVSFFQKR